MKKQDTAAAAQNLIDSLLDELPSSTEVHALEEDEAVIRRENTRVIELPADQASIAHLSLDISKPGLMKDDPIAAAERAARERREAESKAQGKAKPKPSTKPLTDQIAKQIKASIVVDDLEDDSNPLLHDSTDQDRDAHDELAERGTETPFEYVAPVAPPPRDFKAGLRYVNDEASVRPKEFGDEADEADESFDHSRHAGYENHEFPEGMQESPFGAVPPAAPGFGGESELEANHHHAHDLEDDGDRNRLGANQFASALLASDPFSNTPSDRTVKISATTLKATMPSHERESFIDRAAPTEIRPGAMNQRPYSQTPSPASAGSSYSSAEAALKQSESLRIAQSKINELEAELERVRRENEQLATAGETLKRRSDELLTRTEAIETQAREAQRIYDEEKKVLRGQLAQKDREGAELRSRLDEMENRLESNFMKIRVRERELEHRLEIVKMESATLVSTKDKMILDLKRQIDQLTHENEYGKQKAQELFNQYKDKQETIRRVVRALRIALTILEGDEENGNPLKKAE